MESRKYRNFVITHNLKLVIKGAIKTNKQTNKICLQKKSNKN